ncbi:hypothetical protein SM010_003987 [Cronobacter sakazakii]|nr:hypothetical protein [Cronobacter sakazakii]
MASKKGSENTRGGTLPGNSHAINKLAINARNEKPEIFHAATLLITFLTFSSGIVAINVYSGYRSK